MRPPYAGSLASQPTLAAVGVVDALWDREARDRRAGEIVDSFVGAIDEPLQRLLPGLRFDGPDKPLEQGSTFRFSKDGLERYGYKQLSGGEKAVFDLLLDTVLKRHEFPEAVWCIDEPELLVPIPGPQAARLIAETP